MHIDARRIGLCMTEWRDMNEVRVTTHGYIFVNPSTHLHRHIERYNGIIATDCSIARMNMRTCGFRGLMRAFDHRSWPC